MLPSQENRSDKPLLLPVLSPSKRQKRKEELKHSQNWRKSYTPRSLNHLKGSEHLAASSLPEGFPPDLAFRALAAYSLLRTLSLELRLSPFTPNVFLRALNLPYPSRLLGQVHVALLRVLLPSLNMGYTHRLRGGYAGVIKRRKVDGFRLELRAGDNLTYLDSFTWPLFYDDYVHLTADILHSYINDKELHVDYRVLVPRNSADDTSSIDRNEGENKSLDEETILAPNEIQSPMKDNVVDPTAMRAKFGTLPSRKSVSTEKAKRMKVLRRHPPSFLSRSRLSKRVKVDPESTESEKSKDEQSDYDDAEKKADNDDEYLARSMKARKDKCRIQRRKRKLPLGPGSRARDVEVIENGMWKPVSQALGVRVFPTDPPSTFNQLQYTSYTNVKPQIGISSPLPKTKTKKSRASPNVTNRVNQSLLISHTQQKRISSPASLARQKCNESLLDTSSEHIIHGSLTSACQRTLLGPTPMLMSMSFPSHSKQATPSRLHATGRASVPMFQGVNSSADLAVITTATLPHSKLSADIPLPPSWPSFPQNSMFTSMVDVPKFKVEEYKPNGIPVPAAIADSIHDFIYANQKETNTTIITQRGVAPISEGGKNSTVFENEARSALYERTTQGENQDLGTSNKLTSSNIAAGKLHEVNFVMNSVINKINPIAHQSIFEPDSAESTFVDSYEAKVSTTTLKRDRDEVMFVLEGILDSITRTKASTTGGTNVQDILPVEIVEVLNSIIETIEQNHVCAKLDIAHHPTQGSDVLDLEVSLSNELLKVDEKYADELFGNKPWPQFHPIMSLRNGTPYHRLELVRKLQILEFLIDELLTVDTIAAEFTRRHHSCSCYSYPYGLKPTEEELHALENRDECGVCRLEGDLLCCDGCPRSYHRKCLSLSDRTELPHGKWLCPECTIVDSANFGSLWGGKKASVDWFTVDDIQTASLTTLSGEHMMQPVFALPYQQFSELMIPGNHTASMERRPCPDVSLFTTDTVTSASIASPQGDFTSAVPRQFDTNLLSHRSHISSQSVAMKFLVVHGFVFAQKANKVDDNSVELSTSFQTLKESLSDHGIMSQESLFETMRQLGHKSFCEWPLNQIPRDALQVWGTTQLGIGSVADFLKDQDRFDPSRYLSQYRPASLNKLIKVVPANRQTNSDYDLEHMIGDTRSLSSIMEADMSHDSSLALALRSTTTLFNPYRMVVFYADRLESTLKKAFLLNENWGMKNKGLKLDVWLVNVRQSQSISRLAGLIVRLIDATHPRAFVDDWNLPPNGRVKNDQLTTQLNPDEKRCYLPMAKDWTAAGEKRVRKWQQCSISRFLSLLASETAQLDGVIDGVCEHFRGRTSQRTKKRKLIAPIIQEEADVNIGEESSVKQIDQNHHHRKLNIPLFSGSVDASIQSTETGINFKVLRPLQQGFLPINSIKDIDIVVTSDVRESVVSPTTVSTARAMEVETPVTLPTHCCTALSTKTGSNLIYNIDEDKSVNRVTQKSRRSGRNRAMNGMNGSATDTMASIVEDQRRERLIELELFLKIPFERELNWPVAGRKLFQPVGGIPPSEVRHLARNAGIVPAAYVTYSNAHEVGQVAVSHIWRKRVLNSNSLEELLIQIRVLDSYLDKSTISSCEGLVRRAASSKSVNQREIKCCQKDSGSGIMHYFVVQQGKRRGCWFSAEVIDLPPLLLELEKRVKKQHEVRNKKLLENEQRFKAEEILKRKVAHEQNLATSQAVERAEKEAAILKDQHETTQRDAETLKKSQAVKCYQQKDMLRKNELSRDTSPTVTTSELQAKLSMLVTAPSRVARMSDLHEAPVSANTIQQIKNQIELALYEHKVQTKVLLLKFAKRGAKKVPEKDMNDLRRCSMQKILTSNKKLRASGATFYNDEVLGTFLLKAEMKAKKSIKDACTPMGSTTNEQGSPLSLPFEDHPSGRPQNKPNNSQEVFPEHQSITPYSIQPRERRSEEEGLQEHHNSQQFNVSENREEGQHGAYDGISHSGSPLLAQVTQMQHQYSVPVHSQRTAVSYQDTSNVPIVTHHPLGGLYVPSSQADSNNSLSVDGNYTHGNPQQRQPQQHQDPQQFFQDQQHTQQSRIQSNYNIGFPQQFQLHAFQQQQMLLQQQHQFQQYYHYHQQYRQPSDMYGMHTDVTSNTVHPSQVSRENTNNPPAEDDHPPNSYGEQGQYHHQYPPGNNPSYPWR